MEWLIFISGRHEIKVNREAVDFPNLTGDNAGGDTLDNANQDPLGEHTYYL